MPRAKLVVEVTGDKGVQALKLWAEFIESLDHHFANGSVQIDRRAWIAKQARMLLKDIDTTFKKEK